MTAAVASVPRVFFKFFIVLLPCCRRCDGLLKLNGVRQRFRVPNCRSFMADCLLLGSLRIDTTECLLQDEIQRRFNFISIVPYGWPEWHKWHFPANQNETTNHS